MWEVQDSHSAKLLQFGSFATSSKSWRLFVCIQTLSPSQARIHDRGYLGTMQASFDSPHGWWHRAMWYLGGYNASSKLIATTALSFIDSMDWYYDAHGETLLTSANFSYNIKQWKLETFHQHMILCTFTDFEDQAGLLGVFVCLCSRDVLFILKWKALAFQTFQQLTFGFQWRIPEKLGKNHSGWVSTLPLHLNTWNRVSWNQNKSLYPWTPWNHFKWRS